MKHTETEVFMTTLVRTIDSATIWMQAMILEVIKNLISNDKFLLYVFIHSRIN